MSKKCKREELYEARPDVSTDVLNASLDDALIDKFSSGVRGSGSTVRRHISIHHGIDLYGVTNSHALDFYLSIVGRMKGVRALEEFDEGMLPSSSVVHFNALEDYLLGVGLLRPAGAALCKGVPLLISDYEERLSNAGLGIGELERLILERVLMGVPEPSMTPPNVSFEDPVDESYLFSLAGNDRIKTSIVNTIRQWAEISSDSVITNELALNFFGECTPGGLFRPPNVGRKRYGERCHLILKQYLTNCGFLDSEKQ